MIARLACLEDLDRLLPVVRQFYGHFGFDWDEDHKRRLLASFLSRPDLGRLWVATLEEQIAGYALSPFYFSLEFGGLVALIDEFFLLPECRAQGTGGKLLSTALADLTAEGIRAVRLEVDRRHPAATTLYSRLGFTHDGREAWTKRLDPA